MTARADMAGPTRTCVGCGRRDAQSAMLRLRRDAAGVIVPAAAVSTGRSAYVHPLPDCVSGLARSKGLGKSLRTTVSKEAKMELMRGLQADYPPADARATRTARASTAGASTGVEKMRHNVRADA